MENLEFKKILKKRYFFIKFFLSLILDYGLSLSFLKTGFGERESCKPANSQKRFKSFSMPARFSKIRAQKKRSLLTS